jgi:3-mercaptopyruvate sulfurtransferase SseA
VALELRQLGIKQVHPLVGGWHEWRDKGLPMEMPAHLSQAAG